MNAKPAFAALTVLLCIVCRPVAANEAGEPAASRTPEPKVQHIVLEDEGARIEELRVRGQTQRITVAPKGAITRSYEIIPADGSRDLSDSAGSNRGAAGKRVWHMFSF